MPNEITRLNAWSSTNNVAWKYLQNRIDDYYVDCDFNSSFATATFSNGQSIIRERPGKPIINLDGTTTRRFVDIIVHKRNNDTNNDFIAFEFKKWNNIARDKVEKDLNNLGVLTTQYRYHLGFYIILGKRKELTKWTIIENGIPITDNQRIF